MRSVWVCSVLPAILLCAGAALARDAKSSDDDLLGNIGGGPNNPNKPSEKASTKTSTAPASSSAPAKPVTTGKSGQPAVPTRTESQSPAVNDRVKSVPRKELLKRHRLELTPFAGISVNDPYYVHLTAGGTLIFYPHDAFGIGLGVDYFYEHGRTGVFDAIREGNTAVPAIYNLPTLLAHLDMYWLPIYGKVSLFNNLIVNFDFYASAGLGVATAFDSRWPVEANLAIGQHYALEEWVALRFEVRDHLFVGTQQANGIPRSSLQSYVMALVGVSFFIPPTFEYTFQ